MIVLGGWHRQSCYLKIDASGATLVVEEDPPSGSLSARAGREPSGRV
jgi:hypothetical protein